MMSDDFWRFLTPIPPKVRFLPSNVRFLGSISDPQSPLKSDIINGRSLRRTRIWWPIVKWRLAKMAANLLCWVIYNFLLSMTQCQFWESVSAKFSCTKSKKYAYLSKYIVCLKDLQQKYTQKSEFTIRVMCRPMRNSNS